MKSETKKTQFITLNFSVTGKPVVENDKVNLNQKLKVAVQKALDETGSTRPIEDYDVLYEGGILDINHKVESFNFPDGALLVVSLRTGQGG